MTFTSQTDLESGENQLQFNVQFASHFHRTKNDYILTRKPNSICVSYERERLFNYAKISFAFEVADNAFYTKIQQTNVHHSIHEAKGK